MKQIKKYLLDFKLGTKTMFKEFFHKETNKKQRANMWTFSRLIIALIIPILTIISIISSSTIVLTTAFISTAFGAITDFFDGRSARKYNSSSEFGKNLDATADKVFSTSLGISLSLLNPLFLINLIGELSISLTNILYIIKNPEINIKSSKIGKIKQWPLSLTFILGILSLIIPKLSLITNIAIINTFIIQLVTLTNYIKTNNNQIQELKFKNNTNDNNEENIEHLRQLKTNQRTKEKEELIKLRNQLIQEQVTTQEADATKELPIPKKEVYKKRTRKK